MNSGGGLGFGTQNGIQLQTYLLQVNTTTEKEGRKIIF